MFPLTMDLKTSAEILGTAPEAFLEFAEREHLQGVIKLNGGWRVSVFSLASLLNTSVEELLDLVEDHVLGQMMEQAGEEEWFEGQAGWEEYQRHLKGDTDAKSNLRA